jgi:hypothetical protein
LPEVNNKRYKERGRNMAVDRKEFLSSLVMLEKPVSLNEIAMLTGVSYVTTGLIVKEMIRKKKMFLTHQIGHASYYSCTKPTQPFYKISKNPKLAKDAIQNKLGQVKSNSNMMSLSPSERFSSIADLTDMVIHGISPSLLVSGLSGIGKSFIVRKRLEHHNKVEGTDFHIIKGKISPMGLYRFLYEHQDSTIIFDDADSVFDTETSVNILKSALDSYDIRRINWISERLPEDLENQFDFAGQVIFISNMDASKLDAAVLSRTMVINLQMSRKEITDHMKNIIDVLEPNTDRDIKLEVLDFLDKIKDDLDNYNIRTFIKACRVRQHSDLNRKDWKKTFMVLN